ncbi:RNA polymerase sigma-54 factor [Alkalihalophilus pseudofirmus]|nr:RNA polymerase sigma-54 factor [Alkalihalophilus pseudofirmus]
MYIGLNLVTDLQLKLNLTPELRQSIDILQMHSLDLYSYLKNIEMENPLIKVESRDFSEFYKFGNNTANVTTSTDPLNLITNKPKTLEQHVIDELRLINHSQEHMRTTTFLAGNLDENGYLDIDLEEAALLLGCSVNQMNEALHILQSLDPPGIGARNLKECLLIQISKDKDAPTYVDDIINDFFQDLAYGKIDKIASKLNISTSHVCELVNYIKTLNPRPGLIYNSKSSPVVIPDAEVINENNCFNISIFDKHLPKVTIRSDYKTILQDDASEEVIDYIRNKLNQANSIIRSLSQRKQTLFRVIEIIVKKQKDFFDLGEKALQPMNLKDISQQLELHESTISRSVQNKYIQTPNGIFELKYFFSNGLIDNEGQFTSQKSIKNRIREVINEEDKNKPLSDNQLADILQKEGIQVSRRTVAKYREQMRILSSRLRKSQNFKLKANSF